MKKTILTTAILLASAACFAQTANEADTLAAFANSEQEADYQEFYTIEEEEEQVMSRALVQGTSSGKVNTRPTADNTQPCKLWAILLTDTQDESIGGDDLIDNLALNKELKAIGQVLGIPVTIKNITGNAFYNKRNLANAISAIAPTKNDIVFFCFNGHGFRFDDQKDQYPCLSLGDNGDDYNYVTLSDVYAAIKAKGARLNVVFSDCCNSYVGDYKPSQPGSTLYSRAASKASKKRIKDLWLNVEGNVIATASKPGEYSWSFSGEGSAFTQSFIKQMRREISSSRTDEVSWQRLIDNTIESARKKTLECENSQHGIRYMNVKKR